ncbi:MAG: Lrp/AsnC family transcriptional regulator [Candidatus Aenigmatarchaeota archaeon]|jgi:Lrp/AsnC family transcriptional regulator for asnA, asnC and gidA
MVRLSNIELIKILEKNARESFTNIAKIFGVSEAAIRKRIKKLEKEGIIKRYTIEVDYKKLGFDIHALIGIDTIPEKYLSTIEKLKKIEEIRSLFSSTGDHMILIEVFLKDQNSLIEFIKKIEKIEGVTKICPAIILEKMK